LTSDSHSRLRAEIALGVVLLTALALRWPIASHDVEHYVGPDEGEVVENVLEMMKTGDFDHRHPGYPGLHFYIQLAPLTARLLYSRFTGEGDTIAALPRSEFYLAARRTTLVAGLLAALVLFFAARRFLTDWGALLAASVVALSPLAFRESAVVSPDLMLSLFVSLALLGSLRLLDGGDSVRTRFLVGGAAVGLATAIKYTGAFTFLPYVLAWMLGPERRERSRAALSGLVAGAVAFALTSPFTLVHLGQSLRGLGMHLGYYHASDSNGALELLRILMTRGLGPVAALAAALAALRATVTREPHRLVVLSYPLLYLTVFAFFERAFPRHAVPLVPPLAILAADAVESLGRRYRTRLPVLPAVLAVSMTAPLLVGSLDLARRSRLPTPAERAFSWASSTLPAGDRVLEDQYTPALGDRFRVHRLRVEERVFVGNYDWVFVSGYPPGIDASGLREVTRFETGGALGDTIFLYQVPSRASLMGVTLPAGRGSVEVGAGELPYFGEGWDPPEPGAYGTTRRSRGPLSEIFVVLPGEKEPGALSCAITLGAAVPETTPVVDFELNGERVAEVTLSSEDGETLDVELPARLFRGGLNRIVLRYPATSRLDRRHRDSAVWLSRVVLRRLGLLSPS
jgi:Dolichyl-phosphate-mannose-protein mannosyltransferase